MIIIANIFCISILLFLLFVGLGLAFNKVIISLKHEVYVSKNSISILSVEKSTKYIKDKAGSYFVSDTGHKVHGYYVSKKFFINTYYLSELILIEETEVADLCDAVQLKKSNTGINKFNL